MSKGKVKPDALEKERCKLIKSVFSSMSKRIADKAFVGRTSNSLLLCNPISDRENRLATFADPDLCVHLVTFKDPEFLNFIRDWLFSDLAFNLGSIDCRLLSTCINKLKTPSAFEIETVDGLYRTITNAPGKPVTQEEVIDDGDGEVGNTPGRESVIAEVVGDHRTLVLINRIWRQLRDISSEEHKSNHQHKLYNLKEMPEIENLRDGSSHLSIHFNDFTDCQGRCDLILTDGRSTPAYKEFIVKSPTNAKWDCYVWKEDDRRLGYCTLYEDAVVSVKSWQPSNYVYLLNNATLKWEKIWH